MSARPLRILVVEGNARAGSDRIRQHGGRAYGDLYPDVLRSIDPTLECTVARPTEDGVDCLPDGVTLAKFDGAAWTGSALNAYDTIPEVTNQLGLAEKVLDAGVPVFGSCWGLQVFVTALGGEVRRNPRGWEIGIAEDISLTPEGETHPLYEGKRGPFNAFAVHMDETARLPEGATVLATNAVSAVQAMTYEKSGAIFWGVQYHPEFDRKTMATTFARLGPKLVGDGVLDNTQAIDTTVAHFREGTAPALQAPALADPAYRLRELKNWLDFLRQRAQ